KLLVPIAVFAVLLGGAAVWYVHRLADEQAERNAVEEARRLASQLAEVRKYYAQNVVAAAQKHNLKATHDYNEKGNALPLPATMMHELNDIISKKEGYTIRLYSGHPFPFRDKGGPHDRFERDALEHL